MADKLNETPNKQIEKFREAARELETDEDEARFDEKLKRIAKSPSPNPVTDKAKRD